MQGRQTDTFSEFQSVKRQEALLLRRKRHASGPESVSGWDPETDPGLKSRSRIRPWLWPWSEPGSGLRPILGPESGSGPQPGRRLRPGAGLGVRIWTSTRTRPWLGSEPGLGIRTAHQSKHHVNAIVPKSAFSLLWRLTMCNSPHLRRPCSNRSTSNGRLRRVCCCGTDRDRQTDDRQMHRPCSACYAGTGSANKMDFT